ncbi:MAG: hypothetical protein IH624_10980 [Phycisphaerae bacterium]|nr:hypothetical protein [Phycisphaerae bacterium]
MKVQLLPLALVLIFGGLCGDAFSAGSIAGQGRFEKIAGNPSAGYQTLYEWDLFLTPPTDAFIGPCRRLGAPPGQTPTGDGYYRIDNLPAGKYSILVNQPDFFASPKVIPNVQITDGQTTTLNINLDVDYSTYYRIDGKWTEWGAPWYQTFRATGDSVRGVAWKMAGWNLYGGQRAEVSILEDNGSPDVRQWKQIGMGEDNQLSSDSDEWVRWTSGQVPLTPGKMYAVKIWVSGGCAIFYRDKDVNSYAHGRAYDTNGNAKNFDLNATVFVDKDSQIVTHTKHFSKLQGLKAGHYATRWGQTFVATGTSLASVDVFAAGEDVPGIDVFHLTWTIHKDGPGGPQIGPARKTYGAYYAAATDLIGVSYNPGDIPLAPGQKYYIEFTNPSGFTPHTQESWDRYEDGQAYRNGVAVDEDCAMTIIEYNLDVYRPVGFAGCWQFDEGSGTTAIDASGNNRHGTLKHMDGDARVLGRIDGALHFDGINDHITVADYKGITGTQPRTCAAWIKTDTPGGDIIAWGKNGTVGARWIVRTDETGRLRVEVGNGAAVGTAVLIDDQWRHIAVVSDGVDTGNFRFFVDGRPETLSTVNPRSINTVSAADVTLGVYPDFGRYFQGAMDEAVLFDVALTDAQIRRLYTTSAAAFLNPCGDATLAEVFSRPADVNKDCIIDLTDASLLAADWLRGGLSAGDILYDESVNISDLVLLADDYLLSIKPGLMVHLQFDEASGAAAHDSSINAWTAALMNMDDTAWVPGRTGNALAFDGVDDSVVVTGYKGIGGGQSRTVCAWIKTTDTAGEIVSWGANGVPGGRWILRTEENGYLRLEVGGAFIVGGTYICDDQWHHIAVVLENDGSPNVNELRLYVDGRLETPTAASDRTIDTRVDDPAAGDVRIGVYAPNARFFRGLIDDLRIYTRALTIEAIANLAQ